MNFRTFVVPMIAALLGLGQTISAGRPYTVEEMLNLEGLGEGRFSPDGTVFAFERRPSRGAPATDLGPGGVAASQLFMFDAANPGDIQPLFPPARGSRYALGHFSPDGESLTYRRRSEGEYVIGVYDLETRRTTEFAINVDDQHYQYPWISNTELAVRTSPPGRLSHAVERFVERLDRQADAWKQQRRGEEATSSAIGSGRYGDLDDRLPEEGGLAILDVATGVVRPLARGRFDYFSPSPDATILATVRERRSATGNEARLHRSSGTKRDLVLFDLATGQPTEVCPECDLGVFAKAIWSADGNTLVFYAHRLDRKNDADVDFWRYDRATRNVRKVNPDGFVVELAPTRNSRSVNLPRAVWLGEDLVVLGYPVELGREASGWYRFRSDARPENLTAAFGSATVEMLGSTSEALVALSGGEVWSVSPDGQRTLLTGAEPVPVRLWMDDITAGYTPLPPIVAPEIRTVALETRPTDERHTRRVFELDLVTGEMSGGTVAPMDAKILSASTSTGRLVHKSENDGILTLTLAMRGESQKLLGLNERLASVARAKVVRIDHDDANGDTVASFLVLPSGYRPGQRVPTIVDIYPGTVYNTAIRAPLSVSSSGNQQVWAAYGYAYLNASVPMPPEVPRDNAENLAAKVLSAVDAAIAAGYVDPDRIALQGHSFGGWGTLTAISQTDRFKAAVASAAPANYVSLYGAFDTPNRMAAPGAAGTVNQSEIESGQGGMGAPPWEDPERYARNSPLFSVATINTPVMLIQGDLDYVSIVEGEQMFTALNRLNKDAVFVRYWGEWHGIASPANIRDVFARRLAWYDDHLDVRRNEAGDMAWDGDRVASRAGTPARDRDWFLAVDKLRAATSSSEADH